MIVTKFVKFQYIGLGPPPMMRIVSTTSDHTIGPAILEYFQIAKSIAFRMLCVDGEEVLSTLLTKSLICTGNLVAVSQHFFPNLFKVFQP